MSVPHPASLSMSVPHPASLSTAGCVDLTALLGDLLAARAAVAHDPTPSANRPPTENRMRLLVCMEAYSAALTARRLPVPPRLRDDLRLHRAILVPDPGPGARRP